MVLSAAYALSDYRMGYRNLSSKNIVKQCSKQIAFTYCTIDLMTHLQLDLCKIKKIEFFLSFLDKLKAETTDEGLSSISSKLLVHP